VTGSIAEARRWYAEELRFNGHLKSRALVEAFAAVPRERFVGPGPWRIKSPMELAAYWTTDDADPRHVYHDVLIALDEAHGVNNGQPSLWAFVLDRLAPAPGETVLHLGCGTGYYSAILAELVGRAGQVTAIDRDQTLVERARGALEPWPQATATAGDGALYDAGRVDLIVVSAGATHPLPLWLDALRQGGRLLFPLTSDRRGGAMLMVTRQAENAFAARFLSHCGFIPFAGARDIVANRRLEAALRRGGFFAVRSLRRDDHVKDETCWLHGRGYCLSLNGPLVEGSTA
jgi:protein-L-isoaspartate(D-aspartate) O-methyltransferase